MFSQNIIDTELFGADSFKGSCVHKSEKTQLCYNCQHNGAMGLCRHDIGNLTKGIEICRTHKWQEIPQHPKKQQPMVALLSMFYQQWSLWCPFEENKQKNTWNECFAIQAMLKQKLVLECVITVNIQEVQPVQVEITVKLKVRMQAALENSRYILFSIKPHPELVSP